MYMVYWTESDADQPAPHGQAFAAGDMVAAMHFMEALRTRQRAGEPVSMIAMASENPNSVGPSGVADPAADYGWKKRRR